MLKWIIWLSCLRKVKIGNMERNIQKRFRALKKIDRRAKIMTFGTCKNHKVNSSPYDFYFHNASFIKKIRTYTLYFIT